MIVLPDELVHEIVRYLEYKEALILIQTGSWMYKILYTNTYDIALIRSKIDIIQCIFSGWLHATKIHLKKEISTSLLSDAFDHALVSYEIETRTNGDIFTKIAYAIYTHPQFSPNINHLDYAVSCNNIDIVCQLLPDPRIDHTLEDEYGDTVCLFHTAFMLTPRPNLNMIKLLLSDSRIKNTRNINMVFYRAASYGYEDIVEEVLLIKELEPSAANNLSLFNAVESDYTGIARLILEDSRLNLSIDRASEILHKAVKNNNLEIVKLLVARVRLQPTSETLNLATRHKGLKIFNYLFHK